MIEHDPQAYRVEQVRRCWLRGFSFTPLNGKIPILDEWQARPREEIDLALFWARLRNVGLRTGRVITIDGIEWLLVVIDVDPAHGGDVSALDLPPTVTVVTGRGGRHYYFLVPVAAAVRNAAGTKLGPGVDVKSVGGQVVFPGSIHPETGNMYRWSEGHSPADVPFAVMPDALLARLAEPPRPPKTPRQAPLTTGPRATQRRERYAQAGLILEAAKVAAALPGTRRTTLNNASLAMGELVGAGALDEADARARLEGAAADHVSVDGFTKEELMKTVDNGINDGKAQPRDFSKLDEREFAPAPDVTGRANVRVPQMHFLDDEIVDVREADFANAVLDALPAGAIYRLGDTVGAIRGQPGAREYKELTIPQMRMVASQHCRLWRHKLNDSDESVQVWQPMNPDRASLVLAAAARHAAVRELIRITRFPVFCGPAFSQATPGWNATSGTYFDSSEEAS